MPNPTVTIEIKEIGSEKVISRFKRVETAARGLRRSQQGVSKSSKKTSDDMRMLGAQMQRVVRSNSLAGRSISQLGSRIETLSGTSKLADRHMRQLGTQMQRVTRSSRLEGQEISRLGAQMNRVIASNKLAGNSTRQLGVQMQRVVRSNRLAGQSFSDLGKKIQLMMKSQALARKQVISFSAANRKLIPPLDEANRKGTGFTKLLRNLGSSAIFAVGPLSGLGARILAFGAIAQRTNLAVAGFAAGLAASVVAVVKLTAAVLRTSRELFRIRSALRVATSSTAEAAREFEFVSRTAFEMGLDLKSSGLQFGQLAAAARGTSLDATEVRKVFESVATASVALGLSAEQTAGAFRALQQIVSKGTVQAEELRGQLGERIPGAFQIAARAMGVTTQQLGKMLEQGEVIADDFLPRFAEELRATFGVEAATASESLNASLNRVSTAFTNLFDAIDRRVQASREASELLSGLSNAAQNLANVADVSASELKTKFNEALVTLMERLDEAEKSGVALNETITKAFVFKGEKLDLFKEDISTITRLVGLLQEAGVEIEEIRKMAGDLGPLIPGLFGPTRRERAAPDVAPTPEFSAEFTKARNQLMGMVEAAEELAKSEGLTSEKLEDQKTLRSFLKKVKLEEKNLSAEELEILTSLVVQLRTAKDTTDLRVKATEKLLELTRQISAVGEGITAPRISLAGARISIKDANAILEENRKRSEDLFKQTEEAIKEDASKLEDIQLKEGFPVLSVETANRKLEENRKRLDGYAEATQKLIRDKAAQFEDIQLREGFPVLGVQAAQQRLDEQREAAEELAKFMEDAERRFFDAIEPRGEGITRPRVGPLLSVQTANETLRQSRINFGIIESLVEDLRGEVDRSSRITGEILAGNLFGAELQDSIAIAKRLVRSFDEDVLRSFAERAGTTVEGITEEFAALIQEARDLDEIGRLFIDNLDPVEAYRLELGRLLELQSRLPEFASTIEGAMNRARRAFVETDEGARAFGDAIDSAFSGFAEAITSGENALVSLENTALRVLNSILDTAIELSVVNPFKNFVFGLQPGAPGSFPELGDLSGGFLGELFGSADAASKSLSNVADAASKGSGVLSEELVTAALQSAISTGSQSAATEASTGALALLTKSAIEASAALTALAGSTGGGGDVASSLLTTALSALPGPTGLPGGAPVSVPPSFTGPGPGGIFRGLQHGGRFGAGETLMVGEKGPELITSQAPGNVIPNNKLGEFGKKEVTVNFVFPEGTNKKEFLNSKQQIAAELALVFGSANRLDN